MVQERPIPITFTSLPSCRQKSETDDELSEQLAKSAMVDEMHQAETANSLELPMPTAANGSDYSVNPMKYDPIPDGLCDHQSIRLFTLWPGAKTSPIQGHLTTLLLKGCPPYEGLSYAWEDATIRIDITVSGGALPTTLNLASALDRLRSPSESRLLWIDAICINQNDEVEKSKQVRVMRDIYRRAQRTLVWLGNGDEHSSKAIETSRSELLKHGNQFLKEYGELGINLGEIKPKQVSSDAHNATSEALVGNWLEQLQDRRFTNTAMPALYQFLKSSGSYADKVHENATEGALTNTVSTQRTTEVTDATPLRFMLRRSWFRRIWTVQEVAVAADVLVLCGDAEIDWWVFAIGSLVVIENGRSSFDNDTDVNIALMTFASIFCARQTFMVEGIPKMEIADQTSLLPILQTFRRFEATDPRDKVCTVHLLYTISEQARSHLTVTSQVYALLGLSAAVERISWVIPNYEHKVTEVYVGVSNMLIHLNRNLDVFESVSMSSGLSSELPSWVADWSDTRALAHPFSGRDMISQTTRSQGFCCARDSHVTGSDANGAQLHLRGILFDTVVQLGDTFVLDECTPDLAELLRSCERQWKRLDESLDLLLSGDPGAVVEQGKRALLTTAQGFMQGLVAEIESSLDVLLQWEALALDDGEAEHYTIGEDAVKAYYRTLTTDLCPPESETTMSEVEDWRKGIRKKKAAVRVFNEAMSLATNSGSSVRGLSLALSSLQECFQEVSKSGKPPGGIGYCLRRRLAKTKMGYLGLVPPEADVGDKVFILEGGKTPYVLRQKDEYWQLVGECYVHGIMYGEAYDESLCEDVVLI
ncbi:MAG: hypothetical protein LQ338_000667 [Usnochroma carphineum]|nr:MAG: hypothetical protein LQ338_000667 [Usnochroma carphineum]